MKIEDVFQKNFRAILEASGLNPNSAAARWKMPQRTLASIEKGERPDRWISTVDEIAGKVGLQAWQLLVPTFDPVAPPNLRGEEWTPLQAALIRRLLSMSEDELRALALLWKVDVPLNTEAAPPAPKSPGATKRAANG